MYFHVNFYVFYVARKHSNNQSNGFGENENL